jgi:hypothetical protein
MRTFLKMLLAPIIFYAGAWSWASSIGDPPDDKESYFANMWGWLAPEMDEHWARLFDKKHERYGFNYHNLKNVGAEWARVNPQRAYKALALIGAVHFWFGAFFVLALVVLIF